MIEWTSPLCKAAWSDARCSVSSSLLIAPCSQVLLHAVWKVAVYSMARIYDQVPWAVPIWPWYVSPCLCPCHCVSQPKWSSYAKTASGFTASKKIATAQVLSSAKRHVYSSAQLLTWLHWGEKVNSCWHRHKVIPGAWRATVSQPP